MKIEVEEGKIKKEFKPFTVKFEVETIQEARLLYHTLNRLNLLRVIFSGDYNINGYCSDIAEEFCNFDCSPAGNSDIIANEILKQGFEI